MLEPKARLWKVKSALALTQDLVFLTHASSGPFLHILKKINSHPSKLDMFSKPIRLNFETCMVFSVPVLDDGQCDISVFVLHDVT